MIRKISIIAAVLVFIALSHSSIAQGIGFGSQPAFGYGGFGTSFGSFSGGYISMPRYSPAAKYDPRIDASLVRAAKLADSRAGRHSTLRCWHSVKEALVDAGAVHSRPTTAYACEAGQELVHNHGFVQLHVRDPYNAPIGSVLVYGGHGAGHVELRTAHGFASDYHSNWACKYHLIGVYAKMAS